eukprot:scaffold388_cov244-Pinguiococcus_pyrenoidosus.AAC.41
MYLNTASDDEANLQATSSQSCLFTNETLQGWAYSFGPSDIVETKLDFAKLLAFCKVVYQTAAACDVDFTQDAS